MWHRSILDTVKQGNERGICLYGAGFWGKIAYQIVEKLGGHPLCYCDDDVDKQGTLYQELPVYSVEETVEKYPNAVYLVCIDSVRRTGAINRDGLSEMLAKLKRYGVYDSNSELRLALYLFLLDQPDVKKIEPCVDRDRLFLPEDLNQVLILNHMSNSGSFYLEQLLDGHPQILCLPYGTQVLRVVYEKRLQYLEGEELLLELEAQMLGYLHSRYESLDCVRNTKFHGYCVDKNGHFNYDVLIQPQQFMQQLKTVFADGCVKLKSFGHMMRVLTAAYNNCLGKTKETGKPYWLFYHMHQAGYNVKDTYRDFHKEEFDRIENLIIIREPVQQCYSYIRRIVIQGRNTPVLTKEEDFIHTLKCELGMTLRKQSGIENVKVIRFEDLKYRSENTLSLLCDWMHIPYADSMRYTTLNGFEIYFPIYTSEGVRYITGNDTAAVGKTDFSEVLTLWDEVRLNMMCSKFKNAYGYSCDVPSFDSFGKEFQEELLKENFKFCNIVQQVSEEDGLPEDQYDVNDYVKNIYRDFMNSYRDDITYYDYIKPDTGE